MSLKQLGRITPPIQSCIKQYQISLGTFLIIKYLQIRKFQLISQWVCKRRQKWNKGICPYKTNDYHLLQMHNI
ncbi:unnamed protein product [Paramecium octaurelia]|uniref:Uncharacterized protein n=1 Tax=Paramecium octaurelia TaxID=43137 RepID=A0A8S1S059_PAROT|nr:unnamed protein product [Paramecium octaurelia]